MATCSVCLTEKVIPMTEKLYLTNVDLDRRSCKLGWMQPYLLYRTDNTLNINDHQCPTCKARFCKVTRSKNGKITEVEEREQGTNYTMEDAENDYGDSASEESEYGAAHPFIDEEAESGEETSEDEVEAQKECNRWAGYLNCEDERFEQKTSSQEEKEALSDEDYANMDSDYDYDDFVVPDDDVSMKSDASSYSSERGRVKRRRLKRTRRSSSSSSSEIHISIAEEESIDEDQPRRKRRRIDDDEVAEELPMVDIKSEPQPASLQKADEPSLVSPMTDNIKHAISANEERKCFDLPMPSVVAEDVPETRTKKRKRAKRKDRDNAATLSADNNTAIPSIPVKDEVVIKQEGIKVVPPMPSPNCGDTVAANELTKIKSDDNSGHTVPEGRKKKRKKKKNKKHEHGAEVSQSQSQPQSNGPANGQAVHSSPSKAQVLHSVSQQVPLSSPLVNGGASAKKKKNKKKKPKPHSNQLQGANVVQPVPSPSVIEGANGTATLTTTHKKKKKKHGPAPSHSTNGANDVPTQAPQPVPLTDISISGANQPSDKKKRKKKKKKRSNQNAASTVVNLTHVINVNALSSTNALQVTPANVSSTKSQDSVPTLQLSQHKPNGEYGEDLKTKKSKKKRKSNGPNETDRSEVRLSLEERKSAEEMYLQLKKLIGRM